MTGAMVFTWGTPRPGREAAGLEVFGRALAFFDGLATQGRIHGHREYFSLTGSLDGPNGMMIVDGDLDELLAVARDVRTRRLVTEAHAIMDRFSVQVYVGGSSATVHEEIALYAEALQGLGYL